MKYSDLLILRPAGLSALLWEAGIVSNTCNPASGYAASGGRKTKSEVSLGYKETWKQILFTTMCPHDY